MDLYDAMRSAFGGEWTEDSRSWYTCTRPDGSDGAQFTFLALRREQALPESRRSIATQIKDLWETFDHRIDIPEPSSPLPELLMLSEAPWDGAPGPDGRRLDATIGTDRLDFGGMSRCVEGEPNDQIP